MLTKTSIPGWAAVTLLLFGCGKSNDTVPNQPAPAATVGGPTAQESAAHQAKAAVADFLDAIRKRDFEKATKLLTKSAKEGVEHGGFPVNPPLDDMTKLEFDEAKFPDDDHDIADVPVRMIDLDEFGKPDVSRTIWVCRLEPEGWRIGGLIAYIYDDEEPWTFNFEKPEELAQKRAALEKDMDARRAKANVTPRSTGGKSAEAERVPRDAFQR